MSPGGQTRFPLKAIPVAGRRRKAWEIVNGFGGLITYFDGNQEQANAEAVRLEAEMTADKVKSPRARSRSIVTMTVAGIPTSVDGAVHLVDAEVTVDFALIAVECLGGASFGKLKKKATRMAGAIEVKATNVRKATI